MTFALPVPSTEAPALSTSPGVSLLDWARRFLAAYFTDEPSEFHAELMGDLERRENRLIVRIAPRGHAKSTCASLALPLWSICEQRCRNIVIVSHETGLARQFVRDIRDELETNEAILDTYGDLTLAGVSAGAAGDGAGPTVRRRSRPKWTDATFCTANGVTIHAKGAGSAFRGLRVGPHRPDLVICDDIEKDDLVRSPEARKRLDRWLRRVVVPALAPDGRLIVVGSLLHSDSLLANLCRPEKFPRWDARVYRALECDPLENKADAAGEHSAGTFARRALWPARWPVEKLLEERARIGTEAFEQEYQANPVDDDRRIFQPEWLRRCTRAEIDALVERGQFAPLIAVDPATGKNDGDYFAMWVGGVDLVSGRILTRELVLARINAVQQIKRILEEFRCWKPLKVGIESVAYQDALCQMVEDKGRRSGLYIAVERIASMGEKRARIAASACLYENGTFLLPEDLSAEAEEQFLHCPGGKHDDAPDVCAMAIQLARQVRGGMGGDSLVSRDGEREQWRSGW